VPEATVITRKACGGAYDVMASKHIRHPALVEFCGSWEPARAVLLERSASKPLRAPRQVGAGASDAVARPIPSV
jgi:acetyl-CoA carboxylase carboxyltransferase component